MQHLTRFTEFSIHLKVRGTPGKDRHGWNNVGCITEVPRKTGRSCLFLSLKQQLTEATHSDPRVMDGAGQGGDPEDS